MTSQAMILAVTLVFGFGMFFASPAIAADPKPMVVIDTSAGSITVELDPEKAPITVANFLKYVDDKHFDGLVFHRVIRGFMIQGGGFTETNGVLTEKKTNAPIKLEAGKGLSNKRGTIAMARTSNPDSATSQFFINHGDNDRLDTYGGGYAVFGKVTSGIEVVDKIAESRTGVKRGADGNPYEDAPNTPIVIKSIRRKTAA